MIEQKQRIFELSLYVLSIIDFITDIIAIGSLGSKKLVAHLLLVLFTIIIERISQVLYYHYVIRKKEVENGIQSDIDHNKQLIYRACFLDVIIFLKANYRQKSEPSGILKQSISHRTFVTYQTQNIHAYFSSCACLLFQSHGMIYWGSSDPMIIISMVFHFISLSISNSTTYVQQVDSQQFLQLFTKNIFYIISFIGFWSLASELARPRFLLAHMFASILLLILIYILYTSSQTEPKDQIVTKQTKNLFTKQDVKLPLTSNVQQNGENTEPNQVQSMRQALQKQDIENLAKKNQKFKNVMQLEDMSSLNPNNDQSKQQIQNQIVSQTQDEYRKKEEEQTQAVNTPQYLKQNLSNFSRNPLNYQQNINDNRMDITPPQNNLYDAHHEDIIINYNSNNPHHNNNKHNINNDSNHNNNSYQFKNQEINIPQNAPLNSGRDDSKGRPSTNSVYSHNLMGNTLLTDPYKYQVATDGENHEYVIKFDDDSSNNQKSIQMDQPETPKYNKGFSIKGNNGQAMMKPAAAVLQTTDHQDNFTPKQQPEVAMKTPMIMNTEQLKTDEIQVINQKEDCIDIHQNNLNNNNEEQSQISIDIPSKSQRKMETTKMQKAEYHIKIVLKYIICGFFMCMNYTEDIFVAGLEYLNKPLSSFKAVNIVFLFTFDISFNSFNFFPGLRVISIICGIIYLLIEVSYLVDFKFRETFLYEIFASIKQKWASKKQNKQNP